MSIEICNATEDQYGNVKENIFIAFDEQKNYLGSGYVYPTINHHQTNETPYLLFCDINVADGINESLKKETRQELFNHVYARAKCLREEKKDLTCRIYAGFTWDKEKNDFYLQNGFEEDYSIFMEKELAEEEEYQTPCNFKVEEFRLDQPDIAASFKSTYDEIFVTPMDLDELRAAEAGDQSFRNFYCYLDETLVGCCMVREEGEDGWIETLYVTEGQRGKGASKMIMSYFHQYFSSKGLKKSKLEVWELNKRAVQLYKSLGYVETGKNCMFPGVTV